MLQLDLGETALSTGVAPKSNSRDAVMAPCCASRCIMNDFHYFFGRWLVRKGDSVDLWTPVPPPKAVEFYRVCTIRSQNTLYMRAIGIDGSRSFRQTFARDALPHSQARFWSVIAFDSNGKCVLTNMLNRSQLSQASHFEFNSNGSLTLAFAPVLPSGVACANWLPTRPGVPYNLTYRFYTPCGALSRNTYRLPPLVPERCTPASGIR
jgi:hypothetical protein